MNAKQTATKTPAKSKSAKAPPKTPTKAQMAKAEKLFGKEAMESEQAEQAIQAGRRKTDAMAFSLQQLSTPVAAQSIPQEPPQAAPKLTTPPAQLEEFNKALEELKAKFNISTPDVAAKEVKPARAAKLQNHGITRPAPDTKCGLIWKTADDLTTENQATATISALKLHKSLVGINDHTLKTQYARWRAYNGISGRVTLPVVKSVHQESGQYAGSSPLSVPKEGTEDEE